MGVILPHTLPPSLQYISGLLDTNAAQKVLEIYPKIQAKQ